MSETVILQIINHCQETLNSLQKMICLTDYRKKLAQLDEECNSPTLWANQRLASSLMKERQQVSDLLEKMEFFQNSLEFYLECLKECPEELKLTELQTLERLISDFEFRQMLNDPIDNSPALLSISAGAGGLESANWVSILLRMYGRYADLTGFKMELLDLKRSEEHSQDCIDSVTVRIEGDYAYGFLKGETGVHRLIRNSPYSAKDLRHTSFAAISVTADIEDKIEIKIDDKEMEITAQGSGGSGGQNVNMVNSACRVKHLPTGINILVRSERDFHKNKATALKMLKAKLYDLELKKRSDAKEEQLANQASVAFGSQIRTYTLMPYSLVKDHRTQLETNQVEDVLNGHLKEFIMATLKTKV